MTERTISSDYEEQPVEELDVYARFRDGYEECVGSIALMRVYYDYRDLPVEIEIDGVVYHPQF